MSVMEVDTPTTTPTSSDLPVPLNIWCFLGQKEGTKKVKADLDLGATPTLTSLKEFVCRIVGSISPHEIDILYNGGRLTSDEDVQAAAFLPLNVLTVIKLPKASESKVDIASGSKNVKGQIPQIALQLRSAFMNPKFIPTVMKLGKSDMLENIMAIAPGLKNDPVGIAMIQDPAMIYHLSDFEALRKLSNTRPWVVEALNFLAASVRQDKGAGPSSRPNEPPSAGLFNPIGLDDDEDMDDEDDDDEGGAGPSSRITREQLSAALNSLTAFGRGGGRPAPASTPSATGSSLFDTFSQPGGPRGAAAQASSGSSAPNADLMNLLSALQNARGSSNSGAAPASGPGQNPPTLTPDMVARAMSTALNSLPPDVRDASFGQLREQIARIQGGSGATVPATPITPIVPAARPTPPAAATTSNSRYAQQLTQMRELGVSDERLSILALRVSDGDVATAVELIFSGWTGEGADVDMPDEE